MNLGFDPWIPVISKGGRTERVSLCECFQRGQELADLAARPDERVALMRLLIAVAQAALDGPRDRSEWRECMGHLPTSADRYLRSKRGAFELFGDGPRFLQLQGLELSRPGEEDSEMGTLTSKLDLALSTGRNDTLFDNAGGTKRAFTGEELALRLLTYQCFAPSGRIGVARWKGDETPQNSASNHAPCLQNSMVHAYVRGSNLLETVHRNLLWKELVERVYGKGRWGKPVWEWMPVDFRDEDAIRNATETYLGRLVPLSRAIWLEENGERLILANGLKYEAFPKNGGLREAAATVVRTQQRKAGKPQHGVLGLSLEKAVWRELHSLTVKQHSEGGLGGPLALENLGEEEFDLWAGGLVASRAKPLDLVESVYHIPAGMLLDVGQRVYEWGVRLAERAANVLLDAKGVYESGAGKNQDGGSQKQPASAHRTAVSLYWAAVEREVGVLLQEANQPERVAEEGWEKTAWAGVLRRAAMTAFRATCPRTTHRQMRDFVVAEANLRKELAKIISGKGDVRNG